MTPRAATIALALLLALFPAPVARAAAGGDGASAAPVVAPAAARQDPAAIEGEEVIVSADQLERDNQQHLVVAAGAVTVRNRELRLVADRMVYNEQSKDIVADGNVVLDSGSDRIQGEHLELNMTTRIGFMERAQGFLQTYYFTGERIEKRGPDHYYLHRGTFTTCEGGSPDWSFHATSIDVTVEEYLHAWNSTLRIKRVPILYLPYAIFPVKRDRATGLLIPGVSVTGADGFVLKNYFYWAPRDDFDATIGLDYLAKTGWRATGEFRYLLGARSQGTVELSLLRDRTTDTDKWSLSTRNSQALPWGINAEVEATIESDRAYASSQGSTIEERSSESISSSFYLSRSWSSWNFALSGRNEQSLITEERTSLTRFPELKIDRTSTRLFGSGLFLKLAASAVNLKSDTSTETLSTTRLNLSPELTWPVSLGSVARVIPTASYAMTAYNHNTEGEEEARAIPSFKLTLEGPRPYRIWDLSGGGRFARLKHLIEPSVAYLYTPEVDQDTIPQFDSIDSASQANRVEYSISNTLYGKTRAATASAKGAAGAATTGTGTAGSSAESGAAEAEEPKTATQELLWLKLSQSYTLDRSLDSVEGQPFSAVAWSARAHAFTGLDFTWKGNYDVYGKGVGYHNVSLTWKVSEKTSVQGDWHSTRDSSQDFLDFGASFPLWNLELNGRSRYNLAEKTFVENKVSLKYTAQCWDVTLGYVHWTDTYEYSILFSLKGIGTVLRI